MSFSGRPKNVDRFRPAEIGDESLRARGFDRPQAQYGRQEDIAETRAYRQSLKQHGHGDVEQMANQAAWAQWKQRNGVQDVSREAVVDMVRDRVWRFDRSPARDLERQQNAVRTLERGAAQQRTPAPQRERQRTPPRAPQRSLQHALGLLHGHELDETPAHGAALRVRVFDREEDRGMGW